MPFWQVSLVVQLLLSLHAVPFTSGVPPIVPSGSSVPARQTPRCAPTLPQWGAQHCVEVQALSQQIPSTQKPLPQSAAALHPSPSAPDGFQR
jgi:hypothetical protein